MTHLLRRKPVIVRTFFFKLNNNSYTFKNCNVTKSMYILKPSLKSSFLKVRLREVLGLHKIPGIRTFFSISFSSNFEKYGYQESLTRVLLNRTIFTMKYGKLE